MMFSRRLKAKLTFFMSLIGLFIGFGVLAAKAQNVAVIAGDGNSSVAVYANNVVIDNVKVGQVVDLGQNNQGWTYVGYPSRDGGVVTGWVPATTLTSIDAFYSMVVSQNPGKSSIAVPARFCGSLLDKAQELRFQWGDAEYYNIVNRFSNLCAAFYCVFYDDITGCDSENIYVKVKRVDLDKAFDVLSDLPIVSMSECDIAVKRGENFPEWKEGPDLFRQIKHSVVSDDEVMICIVPVPGMAPHVMLQAFSSGGPFLEIFRSGAMAGLSVDAIDISVEQFESVFRSRGHLRSLVKASLEQILGTQCQDGPNISCSIIIKNNSIQINLVTQGSTLTGRAENLWEKSEWVIKPGSVWGGNYSVEFNTPKTSIKRGPVDEGVPRGEYQSLDDDEGFIQFRNAFMSAFQNLIEEQG